MATIIGAAATVRIDLYVDLLSFLFVLGGAIGFLIMKNDPKKGAENGAKSHIRNFGEGAVYFGWLGTLVGLIAIAGDAFLVWGDLDKMGPALAVSMLTLLYGYSLKLVAIALSEA